MFSSKEFEKLCTPAKLYFALAILSILLGLFSGFNFIPEIDCSKSFATVQFLS